MIKVTKFLRIGSLLTVCLLTLGFGASASYGGQLLLVNEVEVDPPTQVNDSCQYAELKGAPSTTIPSNTYFISINSDSGNPGFLNAAVNISGKTFGANGTLTLLNTVHGACQNRNYAAGTTIENYFAGLTLGQGSEGFYIVSSATALFAGQDVDANNDGTVDFAMTFIDGFNFIKNPQEEYKYGPGPVLNTTFLMDLPDAATRFPNNMTANSAAAWYYGELAASPDETTQYTAPLSQNFPSGGKLTPGAPNNVAPGGTMFDFDGDGKADVAVYRPSEGNWYINGSTSGFLAFNFGTSTDILVPEDYDGDGKTDVAVYRPGAGNWFILQSTAGFTAFTFGLSTDIPAPGDYDGDGKADIAVFRPSNGVWYIQGSTAGFTAIPFGVSTDKPVAGDYDGDGKTDVAVFRPSNGVWYIQGSTAGFTAIPWGISNDKLVPADYDGDGKTDVAVFRPSEGNWYINGSTSGFVAFNFGNSTDLPAPADYDGDGKADIAVFRPSNGIWYIQGSTSGFTAIPWGISTDKAVSNSYVR